jgi:glutathione synthase/RimK-type ligase-like ATP-grasp enzyme
MTRLPELLILTNEADFGADEIIHRIDLGQVSIRRFNIEDATTRPMEGSEVLDRDVYPNVRAVWWRQFVPEGRPPPRSGLAYDDLIVQRSQWSSFLSLFDWPDVAWINPLWSARRAENKLVQLRTAAMCGFQLPATILTNDAEQAARFQRMHGMCVVKSLATAYFEFTDQAFVFTEFLTDDVLDDAARWHPQPVIVQAFVPRALDVRVVVVGDQCFAAEADVGGSDWRKDPEAATWKGRACSGALQDNCRRYLSALGLRYAAFDFALADDHMWFLEANQAGEWLFLDRPLKLGIAEALATQLTNLARRRS